MAASVRPWLSVLIPTYNGEAYLAQALESVASQNDPGIECLAVDDGSNDQTPAILESFRKKINLSIIPSGKEKNWTASVNRALQVAQGDYIGILHQDDLWLPGRIEKLRRAVKDNPEAVLLLHPSYFINSSGKRLGVWRCPLSARHNPIAPDFLIERLLTQNFISIPAPLVKREIALRVGGLDEDLKYTADWDFWMKVAAQGPSIYLEEPLACFRIHREAQTVQYSATPDYFRTQLTQVFEKHFESWKAPKNLKRQICRIALFSIQANVILGSMIHGKKISVLRLLAEFLSLGPSGMGRYLRDSRIFERSFSRLKLSRQG